MEHMTTLVRQEIDRALDGMKIVQKALKNLKEMGVLVDSDFLVDDCPEYGKRYGVTKFHFLLEEAKVLLIHLRRYRRVFQWEKRSADYAGPEQGEVMGIVTRSNYKGPRGYRVFAVADLAELDITKEELRKEGW